MDAAALAFDDTSAAHAFIDKLSRPRPSRTHRVVAASTRGELKQKIAAARHQVENVVKICRCVLRQMCTLSYADYISTGNWPSWGSRWKRVSEEGYDVIRGRAVDYGNAEYSAILQFLYLIDSSCRQSIEYLVNYWPSIHPNDPCHYTEHGVSMQGDVIEICLAALRDHPDFDMTAETRRQACSRPTLLTQLCQLCQLVQYLDGALEKGYIKCSQRTITLLQTDAIFRQDDFVCAWNASPPNRKGRLLQALLCLHKS